jgi:hypothetical protein
MRELTALYEGGEKLEGLYEELLPRRPKERPDRWQLRVKEAEYRNYLGPIIDYFKSMLFVSRPILKAKGEGESSEATSEPGPYWETLREDCTGGGTDVDAFFGQVLIDAMVCRTGWLKIREPSDNGAPPTDAADFEQRGLGNVTLERLEPCEVLDWEADESGRLLWAVTHRKTRPRRGLAAARSVTVETWQYLTPLGTDTYRVEWEENKSPTAEQEIAKLGPTTPNRIGAVPLVCLDLPPALWVANRLRSAQLAHFRKVCAQSWSLAATAYAMPVVNVKFPDEYEKVAAGAGYEIVLGLDESYNWQAPPTDHFAALDAEIKSCKDEIFRAANQMALGVENNAASVGRSAESKASDAEATRVVLVAFSRAVKESIEYTLDLISRSRGEKLTWSVEGLDDFAAFDIGEFLEQLKLSTEAGGIPSKTFKVQAMTRAAEAMLKDVDEKTRVTIRQEIENGTTDPAEDRAAELEATKQLFGAKAGPPGAKPNPTPARA